MSIQQGQCLQETVEAQGAIRAPFNGADPNAVSLTRATVVPKDASGRCEEPALETRRCRCSRLDTRGAVAAHSLQRWLALQHVQSVSERGECSGQEHDRGRRGRGGDGQCMAWSSQVRRKGLYPPCTTRYYDTE
jgi:hypothetical protein